MLDTWFFTSNLFENSHAMWLENAKQVLISYINVWYFQEKKSHTGPCPQKVGDKGGGWAPTVRDQVAKQSENMGLL